jgi:amino acid adenylation domain-containing protein
MTTATLLAKVLARGAHLWAEGGELCLRAPKGCLSPELRAELRARKPEIVALLGQRRKHAAASYAQRRLWFFDQLEPNRSTYNMHLTYRLSGALDIVALEQSLSAIVQRHETLRTSFTVFEDQPVQVIAQDLPFHITHCTLGKDGSDEESRLRRQVDEYTREPFSLSEAPLMRARLIRLHPDAHVLTIVLHHIIADGWSMRVILRELAEHYASFSEGRLPNLDVLPLQYADFARIQRTWLDDDMDARLMYWREQLAGPPQPLDLPTDRPRPAFQTFRGGREFLEVDSELISSLRKLSTDEGATLFMTLLAAFEVLLFRYTGQEDFVVGSPVAGRRYPGTEGMVGFFVNTVALRARFAENPTFREFLQQTRETVLHAFEHEDLPFEKLVEVLHPERDLSRTPLFQVLFNMINMGGDALDMGDVAVERVYRREPESKFDLTLYVRPSGGMVRLMLVYNRDLFEEETIQRMLLDLRALLDAVNRQADSPVAYLPLTPCGPEKAIESLQSNTAANEPLTLHRRFERQAAATPGHTAVRTRRHAWTYGELDRRAGAIASGLLEATGAEATRVGLLFDHEAPMVAAVLGALKAGKTYIPMDAGYPEQRLRYMAEDAQVDAIITTESLLEQARTMAQGRFPVFAVEAFDCNKPHPGVDIDPGAPAYILYTSGSTGYPKGVIQSHQNVLHYIDAYTQKLHLSPNDRLSLFSSFGFDAAVMDVFGALLNGATLCPVDLKSESLHEALVWLREEGVSVYHSTPTVFRAFMSALSDIGDVSSIRAVVLGGEEVKREDIGQFQRHFSPDCLLVNLYGSAEASFTCCHKMESGGRAARARVPIGIPVDRTEVRLLNAYGGEEPVLGEIAIRSAHVALGYWNRPDETHAVFTPDPDVSGVSLYRTGDLGRRLVDGTIECLGRKDFQVKIRGYRVDPAEIESVIDQNSAFAESVVVLREDTSGDARLVAYVATTSQGELDIVALRAGLCKILPEYMVPSAIVTLDALPRTATGKIDRRALPAPGAFGMATGEYVAPSTLTEELVAGIWEQVLARGPVSVTERFFDLGGHSLMATQVVSRIRETFHLQLPLRALFEEPTVSGLAARVDALRNQESDTPAPSIVPVPRDKPLPLSFSQQRLWVLDQLGARDGAYTMSAGFRMLGELNVAALEHAVTTVVSRHEILRTIFADSDGVPVLRIRDDVSVNMEPFDLTEIAESDREQELDSRMAELVSRPFDLAEGPLFRVAIFRISPREHVLGVAMHHIVSDAWSMGVLVREICTLYDASVCGADAVLAPLPIQYADFAAWQREWLQGEVLESQLAYWKDHLHAAPATLDLPADRPRPAIRKFRGARVTRNLPHSLADSVKSFCREEGATVYMALLAAFNVLLYRYSGQSDIVVGTPIANRNRREVEGLIGFFVNTLAMRTRMTDTLNFRDVLSRVRESALGAYAHQDVPFDRIVEELHPERDLSRSPIFQVMFVLQNAPKSEFQLPGLTLSRVPITGHRSRFDVTMAVNESANGFTVALEYDSDLFDAARMERMLQHYQRLLECVLAAPETAVEMIDYIPDAEQNVLFSKFNRAALSCDPSESAVERIEKQVERNPGAIALRHNGKALTYNELNVRANQLAHHLRAIGIGRGSLVAISMTRSSEMIVAILGTLKAGAAYIPLDPGYPADRLQFMIEDTQPQALLTLSSCADNVPAHAKTICMDLASTELSALPEHNPSDPPSSDDPAYIIYTSGSTGRPKGAIVGHQSLSNLMAYKSKIIPLDQGAVVLQFASLSFDASVWEILPALGSGATLVLADAEVISDPRALTKLLRDEQIAMATLPPAMIALLDPAELSTLRILITAGESCPVEHVHRWTPGRRFFNAYGPTETTVCATLYECTGDERDAVPIGYPVPNAEVYVLDDFLQPVPTGIPGELYVGGLVLAHGYLNRPDLTADRFVSIALAGSERRLYKTGDRVRFRADGVLEFLGRADSQVKLRGFRIELGEIENALRDRPGVANAVVTVKPDATGDRQLVAYTVAEENAVIVPDKLRDALSETLPAYMIPAAFLELEALPLSPTGKVDRDALPSPVHICVAGHLEPPVGDVETQLATIFCEVLGIADVGRRQRFFDLGGHSLKATQVVARIRTAFGIELPLRSIFEEPTVAGLARFIDASHAQENSGSPLNGIPINQGGHAPLSFAQQRLWFLDQLGGSEGVYTISTALRLLGELNSDALESALRHVVCRHAVLRSRFQGIDSQPFQVLCDEDSIRLSVIDVESFSPRDRDRETERIVRNHSLEPFDLRNGPLIRAVLVRLSSNEHIFGVAMHHAVSDGWSMGLFARELAALYNAGLRGALADLPDLPIQYADFAAWQRQWLQGENLRRQLDYWVEHLRGAPPVLEMPTDRSRPAVQTFNGGKETLRVQAACCENLESLCRREEVTLFMALLAAFNVLLNRYTSQDDIVIGTPIANRNRAETENLIGYFANTLALRFTIDPNVTFQTLLRQVRDVALGAYAHQDLPFEKLVEEVAPQRSLSHSPLFQVMFALQNFETTLPDLEGIDVSRFEKNGSRSRFDLTITVSTGSGGLVVNAEYNADLFDAGTIQRMLRHFSVILDAVAGDTNASVGTIPILTDDERDTLLREWNDTAVPLSLDCCVHQMLEAQTARQPDALALADDYGQLTYAQLNRRANRLAQRLIDLRVRPRTRVAVCTSRRIDMVVALLGVLKAGAAYVPLDPSYPVERLRYMIEDSNAVAVVVDDAIQKLLPATEALHVQVEDCFESEELPATNPGIIVSPNDPAYAIYTSGSTGEPKGVLIEHRSLLNLIQWHRRAFDVTAADRATHLAGPAFDASVWELWPYLAAGASIHIPDEFTRVSPAGLRDWLVRNAITIAFLPTPLAEQAITLEWPKNGSLRTLLTGGDTLRKRPPANLPFALVNNYGPTENTVVSTSGRVEPDANAHCTPPLGRPIDNTEVYVLDRNLQLAPIGVPGELHVGGIGLAREYLGRPRLTAERFIANPFPNAGGNRLYKTGDVVRYRTDGTLEFLGRTDHQVKVRGHRVELGEIETVLCRQPGIREAVVLPRANGPSGPALAAFVVADSGREIHVERIRDILKGQLPTHMLPTSLTVTEAFPLSSNGKVDRDALLQRERIDAYRADESCAPETNTEIEIAKIWRQILHCDFVGVHDNFLDCGGHSMLAVDLLSRMNERFDVKLPLRVVFEEPTIAGMARRVDEMSRDLGKTRGNGHDSQASIRNGLVVPLRTSGTRTPIFLVAPAGGTVFAYYALAHHLGPDQPVYALQDPAFEGAVPPCATIEEMASQYIAAMRSVQPSGPYILGGWSFGGTVAFEMARQLNDDVGEVFLIETVTGIRASNRPRKSITDRLRLMQENLGSRLLFTLSGLATTAEGAWFSLAASLPGRWLGALVQRLLSRQEREFGTFYEQAVNASVADVSQAGSLLMKQSFARHWVRIAMANTRAFRRYTLKPYGGKLTLFVAERRFTAQPGADRSRGWSEFAQGGVDVRTLPGDHFSILRNPNVKTCAAILRQTVGNAPAPEMEDAGNAASTLAS